MTRAGRVARGAAPGLILLLVLAGLLAGCAATPDERTARVVDVVDGDTIDVRFADGSRETIRLLGIDAPETHADLDPAEYDVPETDRGRSCLRGIARNATAATRPLEGRTVTVVPDPLADRRGAYGRLLGYVDVNGTDHGRRLLRRGLARLYESEFRRLGAYRRAERRARRNRTGVWACGRS